MNHDACPSGERIAALEVAMTTLVVELRAHMEREERLMEGQASRLALQLRELARMDHGDNAAEFAAVKYSLGDMEKTLYRNAKNIRRVGWLTVLMFTASAIGHYLLEAL
jgi:hypothetical protein